MPDPTSSAADPGSDRTTTTSTTVTNSNDTHVDNANQQPFTAFGRWQVWLIVASAALSASFSGFASNIYFPAIPTMAGAFGTTVENINLTVTSYMVMQAIAPTFWGAIADVAGRRLTLISTFTVFLGACIGLALSQHYYQLVILRCLQSFGSASTIAIGSGMVGDVSTREQRGGYMGIFQTGSLLPLAVGPILGGVFAETLGWRAIFWFLAIYAGAFMCFVILCVPETLRSIVGNGSQPPPRLLRAPLEKLVAQRDTHPQSTKASDDEGESKRHVHVRIDWLQPLRCLLVPEIGLVILVLSLHYATWQMAITAQSSLFKSIYGLTDLEIGLTFLANGFGCMLGALSTGRILDLDYRRFKRKAAFASGSVPGTDKDKGKEAEAAFPIEQARLRTLWIWSPIQWAAVLLFGWTIDRGTHISAPIVASFVLAWAALSAQAVVSTYIVDVVPAKAASVTASLNLGRCLLGAASTSSVEAAFAALGVGWTMTMWTLFLVASLGLIAVQMKYGPAWRRKREERERSWSRRPSR